MNGLIIEINHCHGSKLPVDRPDRARIASRVVPCSCASTLTPPPADVTHERFPQPWVHLAVPVSGCGGGAVACGSFGRLELVEDGGAGWLSKRPAGGVPVWRNGGGAVEVARG